MPFKVTGNPFYLSHLIIVLSFRYSTTKDGWAYRLRSDLIVKSGRCLPEW